MRISDHIISEIQSRMDIQEVVSDYVSLKKKGQNFWACCPFHDEKSPSFSVAPNKGIYKCFGCGKGGDAISFIMDIEGLGYVEALKHLANKYGIEVEEEEATPDQIKEFNEKESLLILLDHAKGYYKQLLWEDDEGQAIGLSYFKERGFSDETIKAFDLGYSHDKWDGFMKYASKNGFTEEMMEKAGLVLAKEDGKKYDRFRGRVMFPIHNPSGKVIGFGARILKKAENQPKYINSPESPVYHKSNVLFGMFQAKQAIRNEDNCYLVEGYTDVISMHQAGVKNVVASSGTSLTREHIKLMSRFTQNVTTLFDGDVAGIKASMRGIDMLLEEGLNVRAVVFPQGEDPDSYSQQLGASAFKAFLEKNSEDFIAFKTHLYLKDAGSDPIKKAGTIREIVGSIAKIPDAIKRLVFARECSQLMDMDEAVIVAEMNKMLIEQGQQQQKERERQQTRQRLELDNSGSASESSSDATISTLERPEVNPKMIQERESLRLLLNYGQFVIKGTEEVDQLLADYFLHETDEVHFSHPVYAQILDMFKNKLVDGEVIDADYVLKHGTELMKKEVIDLITERHEVSHHWTEKYDIKVNSERNDLKGATYANIVRLKLRTVRGVIKENLDKLKTAETEAEQVEIMEHHEALKKVEMGLAGILGVVTVG
ncbi:MAG: DNA primase [Imperialibacter sp.]|uniref:DNA primase n=1 Tax=Imperialibacter sp. TaxID=2038411 RepID=UPI0032EE6BE5